MSEVRPDLYKGVAAIPGEVMPTLPDPAVGLIMGSDSDAKFVVPAEEILDYFDVPFKTEVVSAHRTPGDMHEYAETAAQKGMLAIIAFAGGSSHLQGMTASETPLPVMGVAIEGSADPLSSSFGSQLRMPSDGGPLAVMGKNEAGAINAALHTVRFLSLAYPQLRPRIIERMEEKAAEVREKSRKMVALGSAKNYLERKEKPGFEDIHVHDEALEGPLPPEFPKVGRHGKVRNVYESAGQICLIASDRVSAFDQVSPTPIPGKGRILNDIARQELEAAEAAGIPTWLSYVPADNLRASVGARARVLPVEMIFRNYMTGSMWREYRDTGDFSGFGLPDGLQEWYRFEPMLFTPSTKSDKDVNFHPDNVREMTGIDHRRFMTMQEIGRALFRLGTYRAAERGLVLVDTKYEMGLNEQGEIIVIDEVHTPDSSRFSPIDGFEEAIKSGKPPKTLSKEFLRAIMLDRAGGDVDRAKELMVEPLPDDVVEETLARYQELHATFRD